MFTNVTHEPVVVQVRRPAVLVMVVPQFGLSLDLQL
jgi:hypothetical protein